MTIHPLRLSRAEHARQIKQRYARNLDAGMSEEEAMKKAGVEWRDEIRRRGQETIAEIANRLLAGKR